MNAKIILRGFGAIAGASVIVIALLTLVARGEPPTGYPPVKQTFEAGQTQTRIAALQSPQPPPRRAPITPAATLPPDAARLAAGAGWIVQDFAAPFPAMSHVITTLWYEEIGDTRIVVFAGALRDNPGISLDAKQGIVIVQTQTRDGQPIATATYPAPNLSGALTLTSAEGERLVLQSARGTLLYFDLPTRKFVPTLR